MLYTGIHRCIGTVILRLYISYTTFVVYHQYIICITVPHQCIPVYNITFARGSTYLYGTCGLHMRVCVLTPWKCEKALEKTEFWRKGPRRSIFNSQSACMRGKLNNTMQ